MKVLLENSVNTKLNFPNINDVQIFVKREDRLHKIISGNKYRKLKYNIIHAKNKDYKGVISFGGAYSNHIAALAFAGKVNSLKTIGLIRGAFSIAFLNSSAKLNKFKSLKESFSFSSSL